MPTENKFMRADGTDTGGTQVGGSSKWDAAQPDNGDTSYINFAANTSYTAFFDSIVAVTVDSNPTYTWRSKWGPGPSFNWAHRLRRTSNVSDTAQGLTKSYATYTVTPASPPGGGGWGETAFNETEGGGTMNTWGADFARFTQVFATVTYTLPPGGGWVCFIGQWLGPLTAVGLEAMPRLAKALYRASGRARAIIRPGEFGDAWRDLREWKRPSYYFRPGSGLFLASSPLYLPVAAA